MVSPDFPDNSRESPRISPEISPFPDTQLHNLTRLDVLCLVASEALNQELGFVTDLDDGNRDDLLGKQTDNQRDRHVDDDSDDEDSLPDIVVGTNMIDLNAPAAESSAAGERRGISGQNMLSEAETREEILVNYRFRRYLMTRDYMYESAKSYARSLHMPEFEYLQDHKKQRIGEDRVKKIEDLKGPWRDAMERIKKSDLDPEATRLKFCVGKDSTNLRTRVAPTLLELSLRQLGKYADALVSLRYIPDGLRSKIADVVSGLGKVNIRFMKLLVKDSPTEISVKNCTNLAEKDLTSILHECDTETLRVLKLDLCGRSMTEHLIHDFLSRSPKGFPALTNVSLKGAFSLTDSALALICRAAPMLQRVNLSECSLLTDKAIQILADNFESVLKGLNIGGCQRINPSKVLGNLKTFKSLSSLAVAGLEGIDDDFILEFLEARGSNLTSLVLASCMEVTDDSIKAIGRYCPKLHVLDVSFLDKLTDKSLESIANGCRSLRIFKCCRNHFSDQGVAAFLEVSGGSLRVLSLNNVRNVFLNTVISMTKVSKKLHSLDLSWCRNLLDDDLRLILHSCPSLRQLKLFGCSQVSEEFLTEYSASPVQIIGLRMVPLLEHLNDIRPVLQEGSDSE